MHQETFRPVYFFDEQPAGWLDPSIKQIKDTNRALAENDTGNLRHIQEELWQKTTGVSVKDSRFTLIIPIHNEERCLPSVLGALMVSNIPAGVDLNVVLVTNGCTDKSPAIVSTFLHSLGDTRQTNVPGYDDSDSVSARQASVDAITFTHVDTSKRGKSIALAIGLAFAEASQHEIVMSMDANNWPEPNTILTMFKAAYENFVRHPGRVGVLSAKGQTAFRPSSLTHLLSRAKENLDGASQRPSHTVDGWLMAWSPQLAKPFPQVICDDYALSALARKDGKTVDKVDAGIWGYEPNTFSDRFRQYKRAVRALLQLQQYFPDPLVQTMIQEDWYVMRPIAQKIIEHVDAIGANVFSLPYRVAMFILWELALQLGTIEYKKNPDDLGWEPSSSTK